MEKDKVELFEQQLSKFKKLVVDGAKEFIADFNKANTVVQAHLFRDGSIGIKQRTELLVTNGLQGFCL